MKSYSYNENLKRILVTTIEKRAKLEKHFGKMFEEYCLIFSEKPIEEKTIKYIRTGGETPINDSEILCGIKLNWKTISSIKKTKYSINTFSGKHIAILGLQKYRNLEGFEFACAFKECNAFLLEIIS